MFVLTYNCTYNSAIITNKIQGDDIMPVVNISITKLSKDKKKEIIEKITETLSEITNVPKQAFVVSINENDPDNIGVGGVMLSEHN